MKKLIKPVLAVSALSLAVACAPAFKGEGIKQQTAATIPVPGSADQKLAGDAQAPQDVMATAHISSVTLGKKLADGGYRLHVKVDNADDLKPSERLFGINVGLVADKIFSVSRDGKANSYTVEATCVDGCATGALLVLTKTPKALANDNNPQAASQQSEAAGQDAASQSASYDANSQSASYAAQSANATGSMTGVAADKTGKLLSQLRFEVGTDTASAFATLKQKAGFSAPDSTDASGN